MGGLLAIMAPVVLIAVIVWVIVFYTSRYVSLASIAFALALPIVTAALFLKEVTLIRSYGLTELYIAMGICVLIVVRHYSNIMRLLKGTENKFKKKTPVKKQEA